MTLEQFFRLQPLENAIVVRVRDGAPRVLTQSDVFGRPDVARGKPRSRRKLLGGLVAFRKEGKKK